MRLARSERQQVGTLHGLPTSARDASKPLKKAPFHSYKDNRKRKRMASSDEVEVEEVPPPSRQWTSQPTVIPPPARMRAQHAAPVANRNARYATNNRAVLSTSPVTPVVPAWRKDGPSAKIQRLDGTADVAHARRKENGNHKDKEVIVLDDEPDEKRPMHAMLDVEYKAPFSPHKDKLVKKRSAENSSPIEDYDDDGLEILPPGQEYSVDVATSDKDTRRITPTRFAAPEGSVKQKVQAYETLGQSGSKPPPPDRDFSAPTANGKKLSKRERMKGKQAESTQSKTEAVMAQLMAGSDASEKSLSSRSRFGGAMSDTGRPSRAAQSVPGNSTTLASRIAKREPSVDAEETERRAARTQRFGPVDRPPTLSEAPNNVRRTRASTAPKVFGPIPLTAFCLGQDRWCNNEDRTDDGGPDAYLKVTQEAIEVYGDAECSTKAAHAFRKADIERMEVTDRKFNVPGGIKFSLKSGVDKYNSSLFFSDDEGPMGWIILSFASFARPDWTLAHQNDLLAHMPRFLGRSPSYISPAVLDNFVAQASPQVVAQQQAHLLDLPPPSSAKRRTSGKQTEDIRKHFAPRDKDKDKDKEVSADSFYSSARHTPWSGDSGEAGSSLRPRSTRRSTSSTYRAPAGDESDDPIDSLEHMPPVLVRKPPPSRQPKEKENLEEIILVWPRGGPGALNISLGDLRRLAPGEFLNDTIIEFGLKNWLHNLRVTQNPIADDIHVFSSFFYKKLNQKNFEEGYQSVRKWTNKVDIFKKKYIIVPINEHIHWYLAIIYRPEYVLRPPRPKEEARRQSTRILAQHLQDDVVEPAKSAASPTPGPSAEIVEVRDSDDKPKQEPEPDQVPMDVDADTDAMSVTGRLAHSSLDDTRSKIDPALLGHEEADEAQEMVTDDEEPPMPDDTRPIVRERSISLGSGMPPILDSAMQSVLDSAEPTAAPTPATLDDEELGAEEIAEVEAEVEETNDPMKMSYIFTFDSLGARHPQAIKNLQKYLAAEAEDKRKIPRERTTVPDGKKAVVPTQPNYCDCGLYLLHFAETFIGEPEKFTRAILTPAKKLRDDKNALWQNHELSDKRSMLNDIILTLSDEWKKEKKAEEAERARVKAQEQDKAHEDSDDEIICEEPVVVPKKPTIKAGKVASRK